MKMFDLKRVVLALSTPEINALLNPIEMYRGKTLNVSKLKKSEKLIDIAHRKGVIASCALGNVFLSESQEKELFEKKSEPVSFQEHMVRGYTNALKLIDEVYKFQPFDRSFISTLHYYMYKDYNSELGGKFKDTQNYIQEIHSDGTYTTLFVPAAPEEVVALLDNLIYQFNVCAAEEQCNKLVLICCFLLDFMCIHPYNHGNGRLSRLLLNFLLRKYGYEVDNYFSLSYLIRQKIGAYIDAFHASSDGWSDNENDYGQYVSFLLKIILEGYRKLDYIIDVANMDATAGNKTLRVVSDSSTPISKSVLQNVLYATSGATLEKALAKLVKENRIQLITKGRYSKYFRV